MPVFQGGSIGEVAVTSGGNSAAVGALTATLAEDATTWLSTSSGLYAYDGANMSRLEAQSSTSPNLKVTIFDGESRVPITSGPLADNLGNSSDGLNVIAFPYNFNGSVWERPRNNTDVVLQASAAKTSSQASSYLTNYNARGVIATLQVTAVSGTSPTLDIDWDFVVGGDAALFPESSNAVMESAQVTGIGFSHVTIYPGVLHDITGAIRVFNSPLPRTWAFDWEIGGSSTPTFTFIVKGSYIL